MQERKLLMGHVLGIPNDQIMMGVWVEGFISCHIKGEQINIFHISLSLFTERERERTLLLQGYGRDRESERIDVYKQLSDRDFFKKKQVFKSFSSRCILTSLYDLNHEEVKGERANRQREGEREIKSKLQRERKRQREFCFKITLY